MINWRLNYTVAIGGNISLHCEASGYPPPIVYWKQGDEILLSGLSRVSLSFVNASTSAAGVYSCIANSMYNDEISRTTFLTVIPPRVHLRPTTPFHGMFLRAQKINLSPYSLPFQKAHSVYPLYFCPQIIQQL